MSKVRNWEGDFVFDSNSHLVDNELSWLFGERDIYDYWQYGFVMYNMTLLDREGYTITQDEYLDEIAGAGYAFDPRSIDA